VDAVLNLGLPAPIDVQVSGSNMKQTYAAAVELASRIRQLKGVSDVLIPQDIDYPALQLDVDREKASQLGLSQKEIVDNVITALTSNGMIAPNYWIDPKSGNPYLLTVQYQENTVNTMTDLKQIPLRGPKISQATFLDSVVKVSTIASPTEMDFCTTRVGKLPTYKPKWLSKNSWTSGTTSPATCARPGRIHNEPTRG